MKTPKQIYILVALLSIAYVVFTFSIAPDSTTLTRYNLTVAEARQLQLTVVVPYLIIWFIASWGATRLKMYAESIKQSTDGQGLLSIARGLSVLTVSMPTAALLGQVTAFYDSNDATMVPASSIFALYVDLALGLLAMGLIFKGARLLNELSHRPLNIAREAIFRSLFVFLALTYSYLALTNPARQFPATEGGRAAFYLPDPLIILTVVLPLLIIWYMGLFAASALQNYRATVRGSIYRSILGYLAIGIFTIILSRIFLRYLGTNTTLFEEAALRYLLAIIYVLLILIGAGFVFVAVGAKKLKRIEEA